MFRRTFVVALALAMVPLRAAAQAVVSGTLDRVDTGASTVTVRAGETLTTGTFTPRTLVTLDGLRAAVEQLRPGQRAELQFALRQDGRRTHELVAIRARA